MKILSVDIGTTSMRGILFDEKGRALGTKSIQTPLVFRGDYIEQTPEAYTDGLLAICNDILHVGEPDAVTLTAFRSAPVLVDQKGKALTNFIMWQDTRNCAICERVSVHNKTIRALTGAKVNAVFTASKITWWKENEPKLFAKAHKALIVPDYLMHLMTDVFATDYTYGSRTSLMDLKHKTWSEELFDLFSLPYGILPDLIPQGSVYGYVTEAFAGMSGLKKGIPVISAGGDQQCSALGMGALSAGKMVINCGTGSFVIGLLEEPYLKDSAAICNVSAIPGKYTIESNVLCSAAALDWSLKTLFPDLVKDNAPDYEAFNALALSAPPGSNGVTCVPLFTGCGTRDWNPGARASFSNLSLSATRASLARSVLEGIAAEITKSIRALPAGKEPVTEAFLGGGMTKSNVFSQILADMTGMTLVRYADAQATAIGAFIRAAVTLGVFENDEAAFLAARAGTEKTVFLPDPGNKSVYEQLVGQTEQVYRRIQTCSF